MRAFLFQFYFHHSGFRSVGRKRTKPTNMLSLTESQRKVLNLGFRATQTLFSFIAMSTTAGGFPKRQSGSFDVQMGSTEFNFLLLTSFSAWILSMAWIASIYGFKRSEPPSIITLLGDAVFVIFYFAGGVAAAVSDYVKECDRYGEALNCGALKTAVAFSFLAMVAFLGTIVVTALTFGAQAQTPSCPFQYGEAHTPREGIPTSTCVTAAAASSSPRPGPPVPVAGVPSQV